MFIEGQKVKMKLIADVYKLYSFRILPSRAYGFFNNIVTIIGYSKSESGEINYRIKEDNGEIDFNENLFINN